ncbi:hypothetical protein [Streptomyces sp. NPDC089919]|uniref:ATP-dependent DNA ligase n=1 Tax=Streptomyces sp. NPDC089919 TaxID=3155188 RepID=UPI0034419F29
MVLRPPVEPMLAKAAEVLPTGGAVAYEHTLDGHRALVFTGGGTGSRVLVQTRRGLLVQDRWPDLVGAAEQLPDGLVLDGELVVWDTEADRLSFSALQRRAAAGARGAADLALRWSAFTRDVASLAAACGLDEDAACRLLATLGVHAQVPLSSGAGRGRAPARGEWDGARRAQQPWMGWALLRGGAGGPRRLPWPAPPAPWPFRCPPWGLPRRRTGLVVTIVCSPAAAANITAPHLDPAAGGRDHVAVGTVAPVWRKARRRVRMPTSMDKKHLKMTASIRNFGRASRLTGVA